MEFLRDYIGIMLLLGGCTAILIEFGWTKSKDVNLLDQKRHIMLWLVWPVGIGFMILVSIVYLCFGKWKKAAEIRWGLKSIFKAMFTGSRY